MSRLAPTVPCWISTPPRLGDLRCHPISAYASLGEIFYFTCIDTPEGPGPLHEHLRGRFHCVYSRDLYSGERRLEIMPATKAQAALQLKELYCCERLVVFGDGKKRYFHV